PVDVRAAAVLAEGHPNAGPLLRRAALLRDARSLAEGLCEWLGPQAGSMSPVPSAALPVDPGPPSAAPPPATPSPGVPGGPAIAPRATAWPSAAQADPAPPTSISAPQARPVSWGERHAGVPSVPSPVAPSPVGAAPPPARFTPRLPA